MSRYKKVWYQLVIAHDMRDGNIFIDHDYELDAKNDYKIFKAAGFMVQLNKVTSKHTHIQTERNLLSCWNRR